ncbi:MAG: peptide-methionine (S)-S-oxide reductase MsrA [Planctomycetes bacterium]|nr:peptide-methionine (S)-S-oxide reductase MsrA [Planctomycetota bacterium]
MGCRTGTSAETPAERPLPAIVPIQTPAQGMAIFAGGCFWCVETAFEGLPGVTEVLSGYTGGPSKDPTYELVSAGRTGHAEAVLVRFDPAVISYAELLRIFWRNIDPVSAGGQFCDRGTQYRSTIFAVDDAQLQAAEASKRELEATRRFDRPIATEIVKAADFYPAEAYHQDFAKKNPDRYRAYRTGCGRDQRLKAVWGNEAGH